MEIETKGVTSRPFLVDTGGFDLEHGGCCLERPPARFPCEIAFAVCPNEMCPSRPLDFGPWTNLRAWRRKSSNGLGSKVPVDDSRRVAPKIAQSSISGRPLGHFSAEIGVAPDASTAR